MGAIKNIFQNIRSPKGNNWKAILLSVLAASVFWLFQSLNKDYSANLSYPIAFDFPRESHVIMKDLPDKVQMNVSGIGWNIFRKTFSLGLNPLRVHIENPTATPKIVGASLLAIINDQLPQFQVNYIISDTLFLHVEPKISRTLRVEIDSASIDLKSDFRMTSPITISPDSVRISGPRSIIGQMPEIISLELNQSSIDDTYDESVEVQVRGHQQSLLTSAPENVNVSFDVDEFVTVSYKTKLKSDSITTSIYATDSMINLLYTLPRSAQASVDKSQIEVMALPETLNKEDSTVQLSIVNYPREIVEISLDSTTVFLKVIYE